jgi:hypothetical protein
MATRLSTGYSGGTPVGSRILESTREGNEEAEMLYLWGPGLDAEVDYRRAELGKLGARPRHWWRQAQITKHRARFGPPVRGWDSVALSHASR